MMKKLPENPTYESVKFALEKLTGPAEYKSHIQTYIERIYDYESAVQTTHRPIKDQTSPSSSSPQALEIEVPNNTNPTVLIVEDDIAINEMLQAFIKREGYRVLTAETGRAGIKLATQHIPDLIICDIHLPGMHGLDVIRGFKANEQLSNTPILMLTADIFKADESYDIGANEYILKPIRKNQLMKYVDKYLAKTI